MDINIIPVIQTVANLVMCFGIGGSKIVKSLVGKHNAPAKSGIGAGTLHEDNFVRGIRLLHQQGKIETRWTTANTYNKHGPLPSSDSSHVEYLNVNILIVNHV